MGRTKITANREANFRKLSNSKSLGISVKHAYLGFKIYQETKGNSKQTISFYDRFYKKYCAFLLEVTPNNIGDETPIDVLGDDEHRLMFIKFLGDVNQQTINAYLRGYRAFGNYCEEMGYMEKFRQKEQAALPAHSYGNTNDL